MDITLRDIFYWLIDTPIWQLSVWLIFITISFAALFLFLPTFNDERLEGRKGGTILFWILVLVLWSIIVETAKILIDIDSA